MPANIDDVLPEALALLRALRDAPLAEARLRTATLMAEHPGLDVHLLPERDHYAKRIEYGLLLRAPSVETAYLTCRSPSATPWLFHQVHDFREGVLLAVDGESLSVGEAVAAIDEHLLHASVQERMVTTCIINRHLRTRNDEVSDEELQAAVDEFRQRRGLYTTAATEAWMKATGTSHARLEAMAATSVRVRKLRRSVCGEHVEPYFREHAKALDAAALVRIRFPSAEEARQARESIPTRDAFFAVADARVRQELRTSGTPPVDSVVLLRDELEPSLAAEVFDNEGRVVGPIVEPEGSFVALVSAIQPAHTLDARVRLVIERRLFEAWLRPQRETAMIEWNWGLDGDTST